MEKFIKGSKISFKPFAVASDDNDTTELEGVITETRPFGEKTLYFVKTKLGIIHVTNLFVTQAKLLS